jgi:D-proline reductase (dithiol) PrdB
MAPTINSTKYLDFLTRQMVKAWIGLERPRPIPWTPLAKPLAECTVALLTSGGIALKSDRPFDQQGEREDPWWGDPSYRLIPRTATEADVEIYHQHINPAFARQDLNCLLPLQRLLEMEASGEVGRSAPRHYSIMGYVLEPQTLVEVTTPQIIQNLKEDEVDVAVLVPA